MKTTPQPRVKSRELSPSPIKIKDFFTNPLHKIKQPAFTQIGFTHTTLNTFVKTFTSRQNSKYINLTSIISYIKSFTNNNPKLMSLYEDFFTKNFAQKEEGLIQTQHFVQFFLREDKQQFDQLSQKNFKKLFKDLSPLNADNIFERALSLGVPLSKGEAEKIIKMINYETHQNEKQIHEETLIKIMMDNIK